MYVFLLTVSFLCKEQSEFVANNHGCNAPVIAAQSEPVAHEFIFGYFASEAGCAAAAKSWRQSDAGVQAQLMKNDATAYALQKAHVACKSEKVQP